MASLGSASDDGCVGSKVVYMRSKCSTSPTLYPHCRAVPRIQLCRLSPDGVNRNVSAGRDGGGMAGLLSPPPPASSRASPPRRHPAPTVPSQGDQTKGCKNCPHGSSTVGQRQKAVSPLCGGRRSLLVLTDSGEGAQLAAAAVSPVHDN